MFNYNRQLTESFEYYKTMKNGSIPERLNMQEWQISDERKNADKQIGLYVDKQDEKAESKFENK
ncbi:MAG: hypothetical protein LIP01_08125 [Tannerellaceae bacterium]|nr:hypothetical protein [Tannerellaceae bacterium]